MRYTKSTLITWYASSLALLVGSLIVPRCRVQTVAWGAGPHGPKRGSARASMHRLRVLRTLSGTLPGAIIPTPLSLAMPSSGRAMCMMMEPRKQTFLHTSCHSSPLQQVSVHLCRFEGLTREGIPHGKGVLVVGNGTGGGFSRPERGDR